MPRQWTNREEASLLDITEELRSKGFEGENLWIKVARRHEQKWGRALKGSSCQVKYNSVKKEKQEEKEACWKKQLEAVLAEERAKHQEKVAELAAQVRSLQEEISSPLSIRRLAVDFLEPVIAEFQEVQRELQAIRTELEEVREVWSS